MKKLFILLQYLLPQHILSRLFGWTAECRRPYLKNWMITRFVKKYQVDMSSALIENLEEYESFNCFFTRRLKTNLRPIISDIKQVASPVDGCISQIGKIKKDLLFQAKGFYFTLKDLLGGDEDAASQYHNGEFATFYLSPKDYHRVHLPFTGTLKKTLYVPGKLFSVNQNTAENVPNLFSRNERLICHFETIHGPMTVILVGAMIVGNIELLIKINQTVQKGDEIGYFKLGSTVILLFTKETICWHAKLKENYGVKMGEAIAQFKL